MTKLYWSSDETDIATLATTGAAITISNIYRPMLKPHTRHKVEIPGRAGAWDFGNSVAQDYTISVDMIISASRSSEVMATAAAIAAKIEGNRDRIIFSDSTKEIHFGQVFEEVALAPEGAGNVAMTKIVFECDASSASST